MSKTVESTKKRSSPKNEDFPLTAVPLRARKPIWSLAPFAVPAMIVLMIWSLAIAWTDVGGYAELQAINPAGAMGIGEALTVIVGLDRIKFLIISIQSRSSRTSTVTFLLFSKSSSPKKLRFSPITT